MKKLTFLLIGLMMQSCWICPDTVYIEFDNDTKSIEVISQGYYIDSISIAEYIPEEEYKQIIDSSNMNIGNIRNKKINILDYYKYKDGDKKENITFMQKKNLQYQVKLASEKNVDEYIEIIEFVNDDYPGIRRYNSKGTCP